MATLDRYWQTVRHLKPIQIYGRFWFHWMRPRVDARPAPPLRPSSRDWVRPAARLPSMLGPARFRFLNHVAEGSWDDPGLDRLWRYNLHYFDDLNATAAAERCEWHRALIERWVRENPPAFGTGWEPYPTSLRMVNWIKWGLGGESLTPVVLDSLATQARWLEGRVERHLLGNHLLVNAKALVFAGLFFEGPEAERWLDSGLRVLALQLPEQILADGGQFELSPMYHALALEDLLDLRNLTRTFSAGIPERWSALVAGWPEIILRMRRWLGVMSHPDGEISLFNDAAIHVSPSPADLDAYAHRLGLGGVARDEGPVVHLVESGYIRVNQAEAVALLDAAMIGPDYLPAHAHADTLSFELSLFGERFLVNSGTSLYAVSPERQRQRGTAAHNTVVVDGSDSSEVWSAFRVARRAKPVGLDVRVGESPVIRCSHDGYDRLPGHPRPTRAWEFSQGRVRVVDRIDGRFGEAEARFHLAPGVTVRSLEGSRVTFGLPAGRSARLSVEGGLLRKEASTWHPEFGQSVSTTCLVIAFDGTTVSSTFEWEAGR